MSLLILLLLLLLLLVRLPVKVTTLADAGSCRRWPQSIVVAVAVAFALAVAVAVAVTFADTFRLQVSQVSG